MSDTTAVPLDYLAQANSDAGGSGQPLCPACKFGRLHPYQVKISLNYMAQPWHGADYLEGWVAICVGSRMHNQKLREYYAQMGEEYEEVNDVEPCGFSMPMTAHKYADPFKD